MQFFSLVMYVVSYRFVSFSQQESVNSIIRLLFIGYKGVNTFPILIYAPIFTFGLIWGFLGRSKKLSRKNEQILIWTVFLVSFAFSMLLKLLNISRWERWPPSIYFIMIGFAFIGGVISLKKYFRRLGFIKDYLIFFGQNALSIFILNVFVIAGGAWLIGFERFHTQGTFLINIGLIGLISVIVMLYNRVKLFIKNYKDKKFLKKVAAGFTLLLILLSFLTVFVLDKYFADVNFGLGEFRPAVIKKVEEKKDPCKDFNIHKDKLLSSKIDREWVLIGDLPDSELVFNEVRLTAEFNEEYSELLGEWEVLNVSYIVPGTEVAGILDQTEYGNEGKSFYTAEVDLSSLQPGDYEFWITAHFPCDAVKVVSDNFKVSHPLYVAWTQDWEGYDVSQQYLDDMEQISRKHNDIPMTHFFNPRIYVPGVMSSGRAKYLTDWVKRRRDQNGDSIGLHLHMFPDMVKEALKPTAKQITLSKTVEEIDEEGFITTKIVEESKTVYKFDVRYSPKWGYSKNDGYDIPVYAYDYDELDFILDWSVKEFEKHGLGKPVTFRAGGWTADEDVLLALQDNGFGMDSSGRTYTKFGTNKLAVPWNLQETTQPYKPNVNDQNSSASPTLDIWEFPNNGADSWAYSDTEMIARFNVNWDGKVLADKKIVTIISHPHWFYVDKPKMDSVLNYTDQFLYQEDKGPVIYINLDEAYYIWEGSDS